MDEKISITRASDGKDYVFISYSSKNKDIVVGKYLETLQKNYKLRIYYDDAFADNALTGWTKQMYENLPKAKLVMAFVSKEYVFSYACLLEVFIAITNGIAIMPIFLDSEEVIYHFINEENFKSSRYVSMSDDTVDAFKKALTMFKLKLNVYKIENEDKKYNEILDVIERFSKKLSVMEIEMASNFYMLLKKLGVIYLRDSDKDIISRIYNSIKNATFNPFESAKPAVKTVTDDVQTSFVPPAEDTDKSSSQNNAAPSVPSDVPDQTAKRRIRSATKEIFNFTVYGEDFSGNQAYFMQRVFEKVLRKHEDIVDKIVNAQYMHCLSCDEDPKESYFRSKKYYGDIAGGICVGTAYGSSDKAICIVSLLLYCGESLDILTCDDEEMNKLLKEQYEKRSERISAIKPADPVKQDAASKTKKKSNTIDIITFTIYGEKYTFNQARMMYKIFEEVMKRHQDMIPFLIENIRCLSRTNYKLKENQTKDENGKPTYITIFEICEYYEFGGGVCVGGSTGMKNGKSEYIGSLLAYCNEPLDILTTENDMVNELIKAAYEKRKRLMQLN